MKHTEVSKSLDLFGYSKAALVVNHGAFWFVGFFFIVRLFSQVALQSDEDELDTGAVFGNLSNPLRFDVFQ